MLTRENMYVKKKIKNTQSVNQFKERSKVKLRYGLKKRAGAGVIWSALPSETF